MKRDMETPVLPCLLDELWDEIVKQIVGRKAKFCTAAFQLCRVSRAFFERVARLVRTVSRLRQPGAYALTPAFLAPFTALTALSLAEDGLHSPTGPMRDLSRYTGLTRLDLCDNDRLQPTALLGLSALTELRLDNWDGSTELYLGACAPLSRLFLGGSSPKQLPFHHLCSLESLTGSAVPALSTVQAARMTRLRRLVIHWRGLSAALAIHLTALTHLTLTMHTEHDGASGLRLLTNLTHLRLARHAPLLTEEDVAPLRALRRLMLLSANVMTPRAESMLATRLTGLCLENGAHLSGEMHSLEELRLGNYAAFDNNALQRLTRLEKVTLVAMPRDIALPALTTLVELVLGVLTPATLHIKHLTALRRLELSRWNTLPLSSLPTHLTRLTIHEPVPLHVRNTLRTLLPDTVLNHPG